MDIVVQNTDDIQAVRTIKCHPLSGLCATETSTEQCERC